MKRLFIMALIIFFCVPFFSINATAETRAEKYLGEKVMCIEVSRIKETRVLDDQTILFEMRGGTFYINRLPVRCPGLKISGGFSYTTSSQKLCQQDSIKVVQAGSELGGSCPLGEFVQFNEKSTVDKVEKLLNDGLLKELVAEGYFKEAFPQKK
jgi:hypothetical protein